MHKSGNAALHSTRCIACSIYFPGKPYRRGDTSSHRQQKPKVILQSQAQALLLQVQAKTESILPTVWEGKDFLPPKPVVNLPDHPIRTASSDHLDACSRHPYLNDNVLVFGREAVKGYVSLNHQGKNSKVRFFSSCSDIITCLLPYHDNIMYDLALTKLGVSTSG